VSFLVHYKLVRIGEQVPAIQRVEKPKEMERRGDIVTVSARQERQIIRRRAKNS
jgi:hypothetical protein